MMEAEARATAAAAGAISKDEVESRKKALKDMMGGKLEKKKKGAFEELEREPWMDDDQNLWSEEQKKRHKEFQVTSDAGCSGEGFIASSPSRHLKLCSLQVI